MYCVSLVLQYNLSGLFLGRLVPLGRILETSPSLVFLFSVTGREVTGWEGGTACTNSTESVVPGDIGSSLSVTGWEGGMACTNSTELVVPGDIGGSSDVTGWLRGTACKESVVPGDVGSSSEVTG